LAEKKKISPFKILIAQFSDFMVLILLASTLISAFMGELTEAITIVSIVILNALMDLFRSIGPKKPWRR